jgi:hypothetical protein
METPDNNEDVIQDNPMPSEEHAAPPKKKKSGLWAKIGGLSLTIAVLLHVILLILGGLWVFQVIREPEKKVDFMPPGGGGGERSAQTKVQQKKQAQITPSTSVKRVFAEGAQASYAIPDPGDNFGEMSALSSLSGGSMGSGGLGGAGNGQSFGKGNGLGAGMGMGGGTGKLFGLVPETMRKRCSKEDRLQRLQENGGTPACEEAVLKGLRWLKANQAADGSWGEKYNPVAMTGLALLAYLGHCETPASEEFGDSCLKGIVYLINVGMQNEGRLSSKKGQDKYWCYEHAIATYALGEAATFCKDLKMNIPNLLEVTQKAAQFIIDNQHNNGGWAYNFNTSEKGETGTQDRPDTSITAWMIQALKACSHTSVSLTGLNSTISKALNFINERQNEEGGYGYIGPRSGHGGYFTLTGAGMLANQMWGRGSSKEVRRGADYILKNTRFTYDGIYCDIYGHYYESQAMMQIGGNDWKKYNEIFRDQVLKGQDADGSWKEPGGGREGVRAQKAGFNNKYYRTTLCILMLEVYYRFLSTDSASKNHSGI